MTDTNKALTWDLESIFPGGSESSDYADFRKAIKEDLDKAQETYQRLPRKFDSETSGHWVAFLLLMQFLAERLDHASGYASCLTAQDVADEKALAISDEISAAWRMWLSRPTIKPGRNW